MIILGFILITELLFYASLKKIKIHGGTWYRFLLAAGVVGTIITWVVLAIHYIPVRDIDDPRRIHTLMWLSWLLFFIWLPRFTGSLLFLAVRWSRRLRNRASLSARPLIILTLLFLLLGAAGAISARNQIKVTETIISIDNLPDSLDGLRIVQVSDLHLSSFRGNARSLRRSVKMVNSLKPDLVVNTGDFVTIGANEFGELWQVLLMEQASIGKFAVRGNHDSGTYFNSSDSSMLDNNLNELDSLINLSGYSLLNDTAVMITYKGATLWLAGVTCEGRHPNVSHGDIRKAVQGIPDYAPAILLSHDPDSWDEVLEMYNGIDLTLSGHTHAMQAGIKLGRWQWSPSQYLYPRWFGLYSEGTQHLYVNRGLGTIGAPVRFGMPAEIALIIIKKGS